MQPHDKANHQPVAALGADRGDGILRVRASPGDTLTFDASASSDPDGDSLSNSWWHYAEAGTYPGQVHLPTPHASEIAFTVPTGAAGHQIHIILEVQDQNPIGTLYDYRRIVIDVSETYDHKALFKHKS